MDCEYLIASNQRDLCRRASVGLFNQPDNRIFDPEFVTISFDLDFRAIDNLGAVRLEESESPANRASARVRSRPARPVLSGARAGRRRRDGLLSACGSQACGWRSPAGSAPPSLLIS